MGYTVELKDADLRCRSEAAAEAAAEIVNADQWASPYHLQVSPVCRSNPPNDAEWSLEVSHFQGDHWHDDEARRLWVALAPHLADGATLEFQGEGFERWRIRWEGGRVFEEYVTDVVWAVASELTAAPVPLAPAKAAP